jgi:hypothetical protein
MADASVSKYNILQEKGIHFLISNQFQIQIENNYEYNVMVSLCFSGFLLKRCVFSLGFSSVLIF